jgi:tripartite-type tricarboxylate transporter receptor subunit TctC
MSARLGISVLLLVCSLCCGPPARQAAAQSAEPFYKGRTVTMLVGTSPGGINDISARLVARHLTRFIAGNPNIVVQNNPGGGGLVTANRLYFNADKDGTVLAKLERAVPQLAIQGHPNAQFDPAKFTWLGSLSSYADDAYLMLINASHAAKTVADLKGAGMPVVLGADNAASSNLIFAVIAKEVLGLNVNVVRGYTGAAPLFLAMQRGELDGQMVGLSSVRTGQRDLWTRGAFRPLMAFGRTRRHAAFPDMPIARELTDEAGALALIEFRRAAILHGAAVRCTPRRPAGSRQGAADGVHGGVPGQDLCRGAEKLGIDMSPVDSDAMLTLLARTAATPNDVIARYNAIGGERK